MSCGAHVVTLAGMQRTVAADTCSYERLHEKVIQLSKPAAKHQNTRRCIAINVTRSDLDSFRDFGTRKPRIEL
jgi:hypothetical protein